MSTWKLEIVEEVRCWLRSLRKDDPELGIQIGRHPRDLVASLRGDTARSISLLELRTHGTIRIAFVYHAGTVVLLLSHGDKRNLKSGRFHDQLIDEAVDRYHRWQAEQADEEGKR